jgi:protocatechuate 3,4-dioxygenase beta subunit
MTDIPTRRTIIVGGALAATSLLGLKRGFAQGPFVATPECHDGEHVTLREMEGPFFKPASPERTELLEAGMAGRPMQLVGFVLSRHCKRLSGVLLDFWQADDNGAYDNSGFRLRGHQFSDAEGRYRLQSIVPGIYEGRTRHVHVKVQARGGRLLTTQLYFPDEPRNRSDGLFRSELAMRTAESNGSLAGRFDFVLDVA